MSKEAIRLDIALESQGEALMTETDETEQQNRLWCMKMNGCKTKCEDCPDEVAEQPAQQNVQYTGNGTAGREADIKPTGFFFQMPAQTEAEQLANALEHMHLHAPAAELRRLVSFNQQLMDEVARLQKREWVGLTYDPQE